MSDHRNIEQADLLHLQRRVERMNAHFRLLLASALLAVVAAVLLWAPTAMSEPDQPVDTIYDDLYHFSANTPAIADEVNSNFATLRGLADDNAADIGNNAADISELQSGKLDKSGGTVTGNLNVNGRLRVGFRRKACPYPAGDNHGDCTCNSDEVVVSGGAYGKVTHGNERTSLRESWPITQRTWRVACVNEYGRRADCADFAILCARLD